MMVVFWGGPWDGQARDIADHRPVINVPQLDPAVSRLAFADVTPKTAVSYEMFQYERRQLALGVAVARPKGHPGQVWVMVPAGSSALALQALLDQRSRPVVDGGFRYHMDALHPQLQAVDLAEHLLTDHGEPQERLLYADPVVLADRHREHHSAQKSPVSTG